jgi:hypothetical protein
MFILLALRATPMALRILTNGAVEQVKEVRLITHPPTQHQVKKFQRNNVLLSKHDLSASCWRRGDKKRI